MGQEQFVLSVDEEAVMHSTFQVAFEKAAARLSTLLAKQEQPDRIAGVNDASQAKDTEENVDERQMKNADTAAQNLKGSVFAERNRLHGYLML